MFTNALGQNQPDRSYYKSLYKFDPRTELAEYNLPIHNNHGSLNKSMFVSEKTKKLPPLQRQTRIKEESAQDPEDYVDKVIL